MINKLKLLSGDAIKCERAGYVHPFTISDIKDMGGESEFNYSLNSLLLKKENFFSTEEGIEGGLQDLKDFDIILMFTIQDKDFGVMVISTLKRIFKSEVSIQDGYFLIGEDGVLDRDNYPTFAKILKIQNCLDNEQEKEINEENPTSEKARELLRKREAMRKKVNEIKNKDEGGDDSPLELDDLVSILASNGNGVDIFNVWDLSLYAFNDQFSRMKIFDDYQISVQSLLAGADPKEVELKYWISKI